MKILDTAGFALRRKAAQEAGVCVICGEPAAPRIYSEAGRREYAISGCCELCFDEMFKEPGEDDETAH